MLPAATILALIALLTLIASTRGIGAPFASSQIGMVPIADPHLPSGYSEKSGSIISLQFDQETGTIGASQIGMDDSAFAPLDPEIGDLARSDRQLLREGIGGVESPARDPLITISGSPQ